MDITTRSLAFWQYQQNQEVRSRVCARYSTRGIPPILTSPPLQAAYQSMLLKTAQERAGMLEKRLQGIVAEANGEITFWQKKASALEQGMLSRWTARVGTFLTSCSCLGTWVLKRQRMTDAKRASCKRLCGQRSRITKD